MDRIDALRTFIKVMETGSFTQVADQMGIGQPAVSKRIAAVEAGRALAFLRGRSYVLPEDITDLAADCLRHRLVLSYEALAEGLSADALIQRVMAHIPVPDKPLQHPQPGA